MPNHSVSTAQVFNTYRKSDAVIIICQRNNDKRVEIAALNDEARQVTGFANEELVGKNLDRILPERIVRMLNEFIEYGESQNDVMAVLTRIRDFAIQTSTGQEREFRLRVIRGEAFDRDPCFHLVLIDEAKLQASNAFREMLKENFKGHEVLDPQTQLPDRGSLLKDLELVVHAVRNHNISAAFAIIDMNHYERLQKTVGAEIIHRLHRHIGQICRLKLRTEDTVGTLSERSLGIILVDATQEASRMVLNRLRWAIGVSPLAVGKEEILTHVNIGFAPIDGKIGEVEIMEKAERYMADIRATANNAVQLILTHNRRTEEEDRRTQIIPVAVERRRKERRKKGRVIE